MWYDPIHICPRCDTASLDECWICGNTDLEVHFIKPLCPGLLIEDLLDA